MSNPNDVDEWNHFEDHSGQKHQTVHAASQVLHNHSELHTGTQHLISTHTPLCFQHLQAGLSLGDGISAPRPCNEAPAAGTAVACIRHSGLYPVLSHCCWLMRLHPRALAEC